MTPDCPGGVDWLGMAIIGGALGLLSLAATVSLLIDGWRPWRKNGGRRDVA